jgi:hypothetical protein
LKLSSKIEESEKTPYNLATTISRIDFLEKWGLTPVLRPRNSLPRSCGGESQESGLPPLPNDR